MQTADLTRLRERLAGRVLLPDDPGYDGARRVWNGMIDRHPSAVVRVASVSDIAAVLRVARNLQLPLAVRGGGHNVAGNGSVDGGIVVDLGDLNAVEVDVDARTVSVGGGATLGDVDRATAPLGLAVPLGVVSRTGIGGLALGGGVGWLLRSSGLTIDSLLSADVVTASGHLVHASGSDNPDLLWALSGGGGNFGIVTRFTFRASPLPADVYCGNLLYRQPNWRRALAAFDQWGRTLPDELTPIATFMRPPPGWELGDEPLLIIGFAWSGTDDTDGAAAVAPLRAAAPADIEMIEHAPWPLWQSAVDDLFPVGVRAYWKNTSFDALDDDVIDLFVRRAAEQTWLGTAFDIHLLGGAFARVPENATAFPSRSARYWLNVYGSWSDRADDAARVRFVRGFADEMQRFSSGAQYVNFLPPGMPDDHDPGAHAIYRGAKLQRLTAVKRAWDPDNVFRLNHNIDPG